MGLRLQKATIWDLKPLAKLHFAVFLEIDLFERRLYPDGLTKKLLDETFEKWRPAIENEEKQIWMKMVAPNGTIVAYARWWIDGQEDLAVEEPPPHTEGASDDQVAAEDLQDESHKLSTESMAAHIKEEKYLFLAPLITAAGYRGQGCGKTLLKWGSEYAKEHGLQCYLLAIPGAKEFYLKHGFEVLGSSGGDLARGTGRGGGAKPLENTLMRLI
ncbi:acyl-CoA N-acyltransferase [Cadophora sp. DSE1049]|nr:acyl-CoA N-acyltransferase [Cadophora sp. DSE1049]